MDFTRIKSYENYVEAHIELGKLKSAGIHCWLKDENTVTVMPIWSIAIGGIKLMVANDQLQHAIGILNEPEINDAGLN